MNIITKNEKGTIDFGKKFSKQLKGGEVILLIGDLGAGKTTFVRGVAQGFGYKKNVTSPTFVIMKVYEISARGGSASGGKSSKVPLGSTRGKHKVENIVHIDTYRGLDLPDLENIGAIEYFGRNDCVSFVEWGAGLEEFLKKKKYKYFVVKIKSIDENKREIEI